MPSQFQPQFFHSSWPFGCGLTIRRVLRHAALFVAVSMLCLVANSETPSGDARSPQLPRQITQEVNPSRMVTLHDHHPQWANPTNDAGIVPAETPLENLTIVLTRSPRQEQAFEQFLKDQQNPSSPNYHHWLTPTTIGNRFGLSPDDIAAITGWLQSQDLRVNWVAPSRTFIGFSGSAADINRAFQTTLHYYKLNGEQRLSVSSDPMIPEALAPVIKTVRGLYTIDDKPLHHVSTVLSDSPDLTAGGGVHFIAPADFATIYDLPDSLNGYAVNIGIVGRSRTDFADFDNFRSRTGSAFLNPTEIIPTAFGGTDPGPAYTAPPPTCTPARSAACTAVANQLGVQGEATLDVLRSASVAPQANVLLVVATAASGGIEVDAQYLVQTTPVPVQVMSISFGSCESSAGSSGVSFWDSLFQQAAAEGISVFVSSGDSGASGCDPHSQPPPASPQPNSPNYICSSSYATCVGGTEFNDTANPSAYWSSTNSGAFLSALSYIPEGAWNEPLTSSSATQVAASGGGVSEWIATPSWQTGTGVPSARAGRYTPDIAFSASGHDGYFACFAAGGGSCVSASNGSYYFESFSGTSAAAPDMAGVTALLDEQWTGPQGNLNPQLYAMAASTPAAFHDVTVSTSGVTNCSVNTPSMCNNSIPGPTALTGGQPGYLVTNGYDQVTGLGSLDVSIFLSKTTAFAPVVYTLSAGNLTSSGAQPTAFVNPSGNATQAWFEYGTSSTLTGASATAKQNVGSGSLPVAVNATLSGLTSNTEYYFRVVASNSSITVEGSIVSFTTDPLGFAPAVITSGTTAVTKNSAGIGGTVNPNGADTQVWFEYGTSSTLAGAATTAKQDVGSGTSNVSFSAALTGLTPGTTYYFMALGSNSGGTEDGAIDSFTTATDTSQGLQFMPVIPCRVVDTRWPTGPFGGPEMAAGISREFDIPQSACGIPSTAVAYSLNVTVVPDGFLSYLTLWPTGETQPYVSTLNSDGRVKANAAITPAGANGGVSIFVSNATNVILDIDGYFVPAGTASALAFYPLTPCRVADTRQATDPLGGPSIAGGSSRSFPVQSSNCDIPSTAKAYSLNVTAVPHTTLGYLTAWATGETQPYVSTLNSSTGAVVANAAIVPAAANGEVSIFVSDDADVILDVNGYFAPPGIGGLSFYPTTPCRVIDTRQGVTPFPGPINVNVEGSSCAPPASAEAYALNATIVPSGSFPYLTLWPAGGDAPWVSTLNAYDGAITSNMAIVPTDVGIIDASSPGPGNLILDLSGYFAP